MSATSGDGIIWKRRGVTLNRCLCIIWIIVTIGWRESQQSSVIIVRENSCDPCYRKILARKRLSESHVRRNVRCDRIEDCHRFCEYENTFVCEGFNYGRMQHGINYERPGFGEKTRGYMCQLSSMAGSRMDPHRDFVDDSRYDYYERDWTCPAGKVHGDTFERAWSDRLPAQRPSNRYNWQSSSLPAPTSPRRPYESPSVPPNTRYYYPTERFVPSRNRPDDYDYYRTNVYQPRDSYLPQRPAYNDISHQSRRFPAPINDNYHRYYNYFGTPDETRVGFPNRRVDGQQQRKIWSHESAGPNDITAASPGPVYGGSYGYGKNQDERFKDYPAIRDNYYPRVKTIDREPSRKGISMAEQRDRHYGYNYGPAYGYNSAQGSIDGHSRTSWKSADRQKWTAKDSRDCSVRSLTGFKISRKIVIASHTTGNLEECEMLCSGRTDCLSFAYRYSLVATAPTDNCLLSNVNFERLNFYTDLEPDRDYDIYAIIGDPKNCHGKTEKPGTSDLGSQSRSSEECFWRVRSGCGMPPSLTREETRVDNGLGECQIACINARRFTCRSFVFRYDSETDREANCFLSDCPTSEIISAAFSDGGSSIRDRQAELYERGSYGRGCEAYPFATIYDSANFGDKPSSTGHGCYSGYQGGCKLSPYAVASMSRVDSENECRRQCSRMRYNQHSPPCMSFSFKIGDEKRGDNCYLSDVPRRDLRPGLDYTYDDDYVMYAWKELEPQCSSGYGAGYEEYSPQDDGRFNNYGAGNDEYRPYFTPASGGSSTSLGHTGTGFLSYNNLYLGVRPLDTATTVGSLGHPTVTSWSQDQPNDDGYSTGPAYPDSLASFNRHYTVNGYPCKRGTQCEINKIAGFWSCEPEGSEFGSWDYCCEPNHHCGFSRGYRYPWCYVGQSEDQWRPCSEKYYPYLPSPRPAIGTRPPDIHGYRGYSNNGEIDEASYRHDDDGQNIGDSPMNHQGRHWPIAFLHPVPPPNTTDSVALANDRRDSDRFEANGTDEKNRSTNSVNGPSERASNGSNSSENTNSTITRIQLHKSHLKRRGLVSSNQTRDNNRTKNLYKKIHRISVIPASENVDNKVLPSTATYSTSHYHESRENDTGGGKTKTKRIIDDQEIMIDVKRENFTIGRIERVTKANNINIHVHRTNKDSTKKIYEQ